MRSARSLTSFAEAVLSCATIRDALADILEWPIVMQV